MPYTMPFGEQDNKWFTILLFAILPFYVLHKVIKGDLPSFSEVLSKKKSL